MILLCLSVAFCFSQVKYFEEKQHLAEWGVNSGGGCRIHIFGADGWTKLRSLSCVVYSTKTKWNDVCLNYYFVLVFVSIPYYMPKNTHTHATIHEDTKTAVQEKIGFRESAGNGTSTYSTGILKNQIARSCTAHDTHMLRWETHPLFQRSGSSRYKELNSLSKTFSDKTCSEWTSPSSLERSHGEEYTTSPGPGPIAWQRTPQQSIQDLEISMIVIKGAPSSRKRYIDKKKCYRRRRTW